MDLGLLLSITCRDMSQVLPGSPSRWRNPDIDADQSSERLTADFLEPYDGAADAECRGPRAISLEYRIRAGSPCVSRQKRDLNPSNGWKVKPTLESSR